MEEPKIPQLWEELLAGALQEACLQALRAVPDLHEQIRRSLQLRCDRALEEIRQVLADDALDDASCFARIEEIVRIYEAMGASVGGRHDF